MEKKSYIQKIIRIDNFSIKFHHSMRILAESNVYNFIIDTRTHFKSAFHRRWNEYNDIRRKT